MFLTDSMKRAVQVLKDRGDEYRIVRHPKKRLYAVAKRQEEVVFTQMYNREEPKSFPVNL